MSVQYRIFRERRFVLAVPAARQDDEQKKINSSCTPGLARATAIGLDQATEALAETVFVHFFSSVSLSPQAAGVTEDSSPNWAFCLCTGQTPGSRPRNQTSIIEQFSARRSLCRSALSYAQVLFAYPAKSFAVRFWARPSSGIVRVFQENRSNSGGFSSIPTLLRFKTFHQRARSTRGYARHTLCYHIQLFHQTVFGIRKVDAPPFESGYPRFSQFAHNTAVVELVCSPCLAAIKL